MPLICKYFFLLKINTVKYWHAFGAVLQESENDYDVFTVFSEFSEYLVYSWCVHCIFFLIKWFPGRPDNPDNLGGKWMMLWWFKLFSHSEFFSFYASVI